MIKSASWHTQPRQPRHYRPARWVEPLDAGPQCVAPAVGAGVRSMLEGS